MSYNEKLADRIREALVDVPKVEEKIMFRGVTFMVDNKMCISVGNDEIMFRIDPIIYETEIEKVGCRAMTMKGREYKGYILVNEDGLKTKVQFDYWIHLALDFNKKAKASPKKSRNKNKL